jgi:hypothetical protein
MDEIIHALEELTANLRERIHRLETFEQEKAFIQFVTTTSAVSWNDNFEYPFPDLVISLTQGTYLIQLILGIVAFGDPSGRLRATIQVDGVSQAPELVNNITQTWKIVVPYETTQIITVIVARSAGSGSIYVNGQDSQLIISRIGAPST